jgi:hypothetical protein
MAPKEPRDKDEFASRSETGLILVSDRTASWEWGSIPRLTPRPRYRLRGLAPWRPKQIEAKPSNNF